MSWTTIKIGDLGRIVTGKTPPTKQREYFGGDYPFITPTDLEYDGYRVGSTMTTVSDEAKTKFPNQFIPKNAITYTCIASVGKIGVATMDSLTNQQINSIVPSDKHDWRFVYYLLRHESRRIKTMHSGVAVPIINKRDFERIQIKVPIDLATEQKIGSILAAYDDLIENNRRRIELLEKAARLIYEEWFIRLRFPGHENTKIVDGVPVGWEMKKLGDIVSIVKGENITKDSAKDGEIPVVAGGLSPAYYHDAANVAGPVITVSGSGANAGYVNLYHEDIWASDCSYINSEVTEFFHYFYLLLTTRQKEIFNFQCGTAQPHVYPRDLKRLPVCTPTDNIILLFEESVSDYFMQMKILTRQNKILTKARDLLLPKLMKGEIDISGCH